MTIEDWMENFSEILNDELTKRKMTQRDLAKVTKLSPGSINAYLNGQTIPTVKAIINISYAFDMDIFELIDYGETID